MGLGQLNLLREPGGAVGEVYGATQGTAAGELSHVASAYANTFHAVGGLKTSTAE